MLSINQVRIVPGDQFRIYVEQLRDGHVERLKEDLPPDFIEVNEEELRFVDPVHLSGQAYLADDDLVMKFHVETFATIPCVICNEPTKYKVVVSEDYQMMPLDEVKGGIYDFKDLLREAIILETPRTIECHEGKCPHRTQVKKYLKQEKEGGGDGDDDGSYHPFENLDKLIK